MMTKGWYGNKEAHKLASKGIKTKTINNIGSKKIGWRVKWTQEDKNGDMATYEEVFENQSKAKDHIRKLFKSAESIDKPIEILDLEEVKK